MFLSGRSIGSRFTNLLFLFSFPAVAVDGSTGGAKVAYEPEPLVKKVSAASGRSGTEKWAKRPSRDGGGVQLSLDGGNNGYSNIKRNVNFAVMYPWFQRDKSLFFSHLGVAGNGGATLFNVGIGQRFFDANEDFFGYNLFYDYQHRHNLSRFGVGLEKRYRSLLFSLNGYLPLSSWCVTKKSEQKKLWERPAAGVDLNLKAYLPSYPSLALNLGAEHYWGKEVRLLSEKQAKPCNHALSAGLEYTPVPLFTAGYRFKHSSKGQHLFNVALTYHFGLSLSDHLDPAQVAAKAFGPLGGFVQRSHQMVTTRKWTKDEVKPETGSDKKVNPKSKDKGESKPDLDKKDESKPDLDKKDESKPDLDKKDESKPDLDKKDESKPGPDKKDESKPDLDKKDESKPDLDKKDESKPDLDKKDESKPDLDKKDESKPDLDKKDESKPDLDKKDESKPAERKSSNSERGGGSESDSDEDSGAGESAVSPAVNNGEKGGRTRLPKEQLAHRRSTVADLNSQGKKPKEILTILLKNPVFADTTIRMVKGDLKYSKEKVNSQQTDVQTVAPTVSLSQDNVTESHPKPEPEEQPLPK